MVPYDPNGSGDYASIDVKDSVAAVYFGLKFPRDKREEIMDILKDRKWVSEIWKRDKVKHETVTYREEHPIVFFQMEIDETHFGKLKAVKI